MLSIEFECCDDDYQISQNINLFNDKAMIHINMLQSFAVFEGVKSYHSLLSWSLVFSEDKVLGLGVDGDIHSVPGAGD